MDLAPLWHRELTLVGAYAYGDEARRWTRRHRAPPHLRPGHRVGGRSRTGPPRVGRLPARTVRGGHRPRRRRRSPRRGQGGLRSPQTERNHPMSPRPGFVLDVDRSTPPTLFWHGERFSLETAAGRAAGSSMRPSRSRRCRTRRRPSAPRSAIRWVTAIRSPPCCSPGMKLTIAFDDISLPLPPMERPDIRQMVIEQVLDMAAAAGVDDVELIVALALHRRMTEPELRHAIGDRIYDAFAPNGLLTQHDAEDPDALVHLGTHRRGRGRRDQQAGGGERPAGLRQHQPGGHGRRATRAWPPGWPATRAYGTTTTRRPCSGADRSWTSTAPSSTRPTGGWVASSPRAASRCSRSRPP